MFDRNYLKEMRQALPPHTPTPNPSCAMTMLNQSLTLSLLFSPGQSRLHSSAQASLTALPPDLPGSCPNPNPNGARRPQ